MLPPPSRPIAGGAKAGGLCLAEIARSWPLQRSSIAGRLTLSTTCPRSMMIREKAVFPDGIAGSEIVICGFNGVGQLLASFVQDSEIMSRDRGNKSKDVMRYVGFDLDPKVVMKTLEMESVYYMAMEA